MLLFLIVVLIVVSGLIAYLGDQIGMKIGKRRLSIFGIRPKYTSIIITIITGILIATFTVTLLLVASKGVRMAVFDMQKLISELGSLNRQVQEKDKRLQNMAGEIKNTTALVADIRQQKEQIQTELKQKLQELEKKQVEYSAMEASLKKAQANFDSLARANMELEKSKSELSQKVSTIDQQRAELEKQKNTLDKQKIDLEKQKKNLEGDVVSLQNDIKTLTDEVNKISGEAQALTWKVAHMEIESDGYQITDILYRKGELVYLESLDTIPGAPPAQIVKVIDDFLQRANKLVQKRKVKINEADGRSIMLPGEQLYEIARALKDPSNDKILVGIYPNKNIWVDNFVDASIKWEKNYKVYRKNDVIVQKEIDASQDPAVIEKQLTEVLNDVSQRSTERGLLPNASGQVGTIGFTDFYTVVENVKNLSGKVKIAIEATKDIWRQESLTSDNIKFEVQPARGSS